MNDNHAAQLPDSVPISRYSAPEDLPFIIGVKDAATWLGVHHDTLRGHASSGKVPCIRVGGKLCFRRDQLLASMERAGKTKSVNRKEHR